MSGRPGEYVIPAQADGDAIGEAAHRVASHQVDWAAERDRDRAGAEHEV